jgi:hypothetical protein
VARAEQTPSVVVGNVSLPAESLSPTVEPLGRCPAQPFGPLAVVANVEHFVQTS